MGVNWKKTMLQIAKLFVEFIKLTGTVLTFWDFFRSPGKTYLFIEYRFD